MIVEYLKNMHPLGWVVVGSLFWAVTLVLASIVIEVFSFIVSRPFMCRHLGHIVDPEQLESWTRDKSKVLWCRRCKQPIDKP